MYNNFYIWKLKNKKQKHLYHIVSISPWPLLGAFSTFLFVISLAMYFHQFKFGFILVLFSFFLILITMQRWWADVIKEATWAGYHTKLIQKGLKIGIILFIISEIMFFFAFFWAFFHSSLAPITQIGSTWPPTGVIPLDPFNIPIINTAILLLSGCTLTLSHYALRVNKIFFQYLGLGCTIFFAIQFTFEQLYEYIIAPFSLSDSIYGTTFYMATGLHGLHVIVGTLFLIICFIRLFFGHYSAIHHVGFEAAIWYWHFVDVVWLFLFATIYCWGAGIF